VQILGSAFEAASPNRGRRPHADDTAEYLRMRLRRAGCNRELFAPEAAALLHEATGGPMRDIDRLAAAALRPAHRNASSSNATPSLASSRPIRATATIAPRLPITCLHPP
jgi:hypothetical protein